MQTFWKLLSWLFIVLCFNFLFRQHRWILWRQSLCERSWERDIIKNKLRSERNSTSTQQVLIGLFPDTFKYVFNFFNFAISMRCIGNYHYHRTFNMSSNLISILKMFTWCGRNEYCDGGTWHFDEWGGEKTSLGVLIAIKGSYR